MMWLIVFVYILYIYFVILCLCEGVYLKPESDCCSLSSVLRLNSLIYLYFTFVLTSFLCYFTKGTGEKFL